MSEKIKVEKWKSNEVLKGLGRTLDQIIEANPGTKIEHNAFGHTTSQHSKHGRLKHYDRENQTCILEFYGKDGTTQQFQVTPKDPEKFLKYLRENKYETHN